LEEASELAQHQSGDICLDWRRVLDLAEQMGCGQPRFLKLLLFIVVKPVPTFRWLLQSRSSRRISVEECAEPPVAECKYQTAL